MLVGEKSVLGRWTDFEGVNLCCNLGTQYLLPLSCITYTTLNSAPSRTHSLKHTLDTYSLKHALSKILFSDQCQQQF